MPRQADHLPEAAPMSEPHPAGVGGESSEHRAVCVYTGPTPHGPQCGEAATTHLLVQSATYGVVALASCPAHRPVALAAGTPLDEHPHRGLCGLPGTVWLHTPESRCAIDDSGFEPVLVGASGLPLEDTEHD